MSNQFRIKPIRHGEVMLRPTGVVNPTDFKVHASLVVGHSETGHHHVLEATEGSKIISWTDPETHDLFVEVFGEAKLVHKKEVNRHRDLNVKPGTYRVSQKREYNPYTKAMQSVWD